MKNSNTVIKYKNYEVNVPNKYVNWIIFLAFFYVTLYGSASLLTAIAALKHG